MSETVNVIVDAAVSWVQQLTHTLRMFLRGHGRSTGEINASMFCYGTVVLLAAAGNADCFDASAAKLKLAVTPLAQNVDTSINVFAVTGKNDTNLGK